MNVDLASDPFAFDLSDQLAARAPRRYYNRTTVVLAGLVLLAAGFFAGAQVKKSYGTPTSASSAGATVPNVAGGSFAGRRQNGGTGQSSGASTDGTAANVTTGTVKLVDGTTVYVQTADGTVVTVRTSGSTTVQVAQNGALSDLAPGARVSVEGPAVSDGTVTATKITKAR